MGVLTCGFTSSKHNCFVGWIFMCFEGWSFIFGLVAYIFLVQYMITKSRYLDIEYYALICASVHLCTAIFLFLTDIIFKSDTMFIVGQSESTVGNMTSVTTFGATETNRQIQIENEEEGHCLHFLKQNPWSLYRKHYVILSIKIICLVLDIVILIMFNEGWQCAYKKC